MCTHQRFVFNKYTKKSFLVKCGKCLSCLQEKAYRRSSRIKNEVSPDKICLFVTLTYDRSSCPFVFQKDIDNRSDVLPIYREHITRRVKRVTKDGVKYLDGRKYQLTKLSEIYFPDYDSFMKISKDGILSYNTKLRHLAYRSDHVGVCYYPDVQLFKKRLAINLKRIYNYEEKFKCYSCSEYGETTGRPHFHLLLFIPTYAESIFRSAISQAWPFASHRRTEKYIEIARDVANYVASYVNSGVHLHKFLTTNFKVKHSYSKDFGMAPKLFSLDSILQKIDRCDLSYLRGIGPKGKELYVNFCIPKYVINRYFPIFKGFSRFTDFEVCDVLRSFIQPGIRKPKTPLISLDKLLSIDYSSDDLYKITIRLTNAYKRYLKAINLLHSESSLEDYIYKFREAWKVFKLTQMRLWYNDTTIDPKYMYDNTQQLSCGLINSPDTFDYLASTPACFIPDPNDYPQNRNISAKYESIYYFRCKERKINNSVMAHNHYYF